MARAAVYDIVGPGQNEGIVIAGPDDVLDIGKAIGGTVGVGGRPDREIDGDRVGRVTVTDRVRARAAVDYVIAAAPDRIVAVTAIDSVVARTPVDEVVAVAAIEGVAAAHAMDHVVPGAAGDRVVPGGAKDGFAAVACGIAAADEMPVGIVVQIYGEPVGQGQVFDVLVGISAGAKLLLNGDVVAGACR